MAKTLRGLVAATGTALILTSSAAAADISDLHRLGYGTIRSIAGDCTFWKATGFGASIDLGSDCWPGFQDKLDAFVAGHPERKLSYEHPAAVAARADVLAKGYAVATAYEPPAFRITGGCDLDVTVPPAELVALAPTLATAAPCPATPPAEEPLAEEPAPTGEEPAAGATLEERVTEIETALAALASRVTALRDANLAAWNAFVDALAAGYPAPEAALAARSAAMNAIYRL